jgi:hypothetical protein
MVLPISLNPCEDLNSEVDELIHSFEQEGTKLRSEVEDLRQSLTDHIDPPSAQEAVADAVGLAGANDVDAGLTAMTQIRNFTGNCLNSVFNQSKKYSAILDHEITDKIGQITSFIALPEVNLLSPLRGLRSSMGVSEIGGLLDHIDTKMGCLSGQGSEIGECLSILDNFNDRIDDVLSYLGMGDQAADLVQNFDVQNIIDSFNIPIDADVVTNLDSLDIKMDDITVEAFNNIRSVLGSLFTPYEWF